MLKSVAFQAALGSIHIPEGSQALQIALSSIHNPENAMSFVGCFSSNHMGAPHGRKDPEDVRHGFGFIGRPCVG